MESKINSAGSWNVMELKKKLQRGNEKKVSTMTKFLVKLLNLEI